MTTTLDARLRFDGEREGDREGDGGLRSGLRRSLTSACRRDRCERVASRRESALDVVVRVGGR